MDPPKNSLCQNLRYFRYVISSFRSYNLVCCFLQTDSAALCNPSAIDWYHIHAKDNFSCITPCQGIYADVNYQNESLVENTGKVFQPITMDYTDWKKQVTEDFHFARTPIREYGMLILLTQFSNIYSM